MESEFWMFHPCQSWQEDSKCWCDDWSSQKWSFVLVCNFWGTCSKHWIKFHEQGKSTDSKFQLSRNCYIPLFFKSLTFYIQIQYVRDTPISDNSLGLASIQDSAGPLRLKEDDLVANTILEKASDWTSPKPLLMALLQRLIQEMSLPFANQVIMAALKHDQGNLQFGNIICKVLLDISCTLSVFTRCFIIWLLGKESFLEISREIIIVPNDNHDRLWCHCTVWSDYKCLYIFIFENNFIYLVLNEAQQSQDDKWTSFLEKNDLLDVSFLFKLLVFWSRDFWKRNKLNEDNCASIRYVICSMIMNNTDARTYVLKICTQNLISVALNQGNHG